jgi:L-lysine exporter family protein LysE/ArgO
MIRVMFQGLALGLGAAAPIGPVNVEIARRSLKNGFKAGAALGAGAATVDLIYAIIVSILMGTLLKDDERRKALEHSPVILILMIASGLLLGYLGFLCLREYWRNKDPDLTPDSQPIIRGYFTGLLMTSLNPMTLIFWFVGVAGKATTIDNPAQNLPFLATGVFISALGWALTFAAIITRIGSMAKHRVMRLANLAGGIILLGFALAPVWKWSWNALK